MTIQYVYYPLEICLCPADYTGETWRMTCTALTTDGCSDGWWKLVCDDTEKKLTVFLDKKSYMVAGGHVYLYRDYGKLAVEIENIRLERALEAL